MKSYSLEITTSPFNEHPFVDYRIQEPIHFDISTKGWDCEPDFRKGNDFNLKAYCECLVEKLLNIKLTEIKSFLEYQCRKVKSPEEWLLQVESLIEINNGIFFKENCRYAKLSIALDALTEKYQERHVVAQQFDFDSLKVRLKRLDKYEDKIKVLIEEKIEYLQYNIQNSNAVQDAYIKKIELEILKLTDIQSLNGQEKSQISNLTFQEAVPRLKLNGNINIIVDAFYQAMRVPSPEGKPYLEGSIKEVAQAICSIFIDKNGNELVPSTVQTILSPSKYDKRPKSNKRIIVSSD